MGKKASVESKVTTKAKGGRPSLYKKEFVTQVYKLCLLGADDNRIANFFDVDVATINRWKTLHPEFCESIKNGKEKADAEIAYSLYHRALGYSHKEDKIFNNDGTPMIVPTIKHYPPDTTAAIFWLKNRQRINWRDKNDIEVTGKDGGAIQVQNMSSEEIDSRISELISKVNSADG